MDKINFSYSMKNVPVPTKPEYQKQLILQIEKCLRNFRWKAKHVLKYGQNENNDESYVERETYGFKCASTPSIVDELREFELEVTNLVNEIDY